PDGGRQGLAGAPKGPRMPGSSACRNAQQAHAPDKRTCDPIPNPDLPQAISAIALPGPLDEQPARQLAGFVGQTFSRSSKSWQPLASPAGGRSVTLARWPRSIPSPEV